MSRVAFLLSLVLAGSLLPAAAQDASRLVEAGRQALEASRPAEALEALEAAARLAPESAEAHSLLGRAYLLDHQAKPAAAALERAVELGAADARTLLHLGSASWELGRLDEAERRFREVAGAGSGAAVLIALQQLGRLLLFQGRPAEALDPLRRAVVLLPEDVDLQLQLAQALDGAGAGYGEEALAAWRRAVEMAPALARARYGLARRLLRSGSQGHREEAAREMEAYRRLSEKERETARRANLERARLDRGWELLRQGRAIEAAALFAALLGSAETPEALAGVAFSRSAAGDPRGAVQALERAVALAPERDDLRRALDEERLKAEGDRP